jgi:hypothetical protein
MKVEVWLLHSAIAPWRNNTPWCVFYGQKGLIYGNPSPDVGAVRSTYQASIKDLRLMSARVAVQLAW